MTIFFTSDTHFGHERILTLANRPFADVEEMNAEIIRRWNNTVNPEDTVYHLGDVALGKIAESLPLVGQLNGRKILVVGNHDRLFSTNKQSHIDRFWPEYEKVFDSIVDESGLIFSTAHPDDPCGEGIDFSVSHFPYDGDSHDEDRYADKRPVDLGNPLIHGHTHSEDIVTWSNKGTLQIHVGVDAWEFTPASLDEILSIVDADNYIGAGRYA